MPLETINALIIRSQSNVFDIAVIFFDILSMLKLFEGVKSKHFPSGTIYRCDVLEHELISALIQQLNNYFFSRASSFATSQLPTSQVLRPSVLTTACCVIAIAARLDPRLIYRNGWRDLVGKFIECGMISTSLSADEYVKSTLIACVQHRLEQSTPFAPAIISPPPPPPPLLEEADEVIDQQLPSYSHLFLTQKLLKHTVEPPSHLVHASEIVGAFWLRNMDRKWVIDENTQRSQPPLLFWQHNRVESPILADIAQQVLLISISTAGVERLFSFCGDLCSSDTAQMADLTIEQRIFCSRNLSLLPLPE